MAFFPRAQPVAPADLAQHGWASLAPQVDFDSQRRQLATVLPPFVCPEYTGPYGPGSRRVRPRRSYGPGDTFEFLQLEYRNGYSSVLLANGSWVNVWTVYAASGNVTRRAGGLPFATLRSEPLEGGPRPRSANPGD